MIRYSLRIRRHGVTEDAGCGPVSITSRASSAGVPRLIAEDEAGHVATIWWPVPWFGDETIRIVGHEYNAHKSIGTSVEWHITPVAKDKT